MAPDITLSYREAGYYHTKHSTRKHPNYYSVHWDLRIRHPITTAAARDHYSKAYLPTSVEDRFLPQHGHRSSSSGSNSSRHGHGHGQGYEHHRSGSEMSPPRHHRLEYPPEDQVVRYNRGSPYHGSGGGGGGGGSTHSSSSSFSGLNSRPNRSFRSHGPHDYGHPWGQHSGPHSSRGSDVGSHRSGWSGGSSRYSDYDNHPSPRRSWPNGGGGPWSGRSSGRGSEYSSSSSRYAEMGSGSGRSRYYGDGY